MSTGMVVAGIGKAYSGRDVLSGVDLELRSGEIHALLGPNGSGKSTLIGCISGKTRPDRGTLSVAGAEHRGLTPRGAIDAGVAVIYQHFSLTPELSVADNIFLGSELRRGAFLRRRPQREAAARLLDEIGHPIDPDRLVRSLSVGERQLVEIAKALRRRPSVLVLDEPTAAIGHREAQQLGRYLQRLRDSGMAILYVTHLLNEVFAIADRVTVLRDGRVALAERVEQLDVSKVVAAISPSSRTDAASDRRRAGGDVVLELDAYEAPGVGPIDLTLRKGEILGLFGLLGSGRTELLEGLFGVSTQTGGEARLHGARYRPKGPLDALREGIALVPGDRLRQSMFSRLTALENVLAPHMRRLTRFGLRRRGSEAREFRATAERLKVHPPIAAADAETFSGGNQQKLALGRWLTASSRVELLLLDEPTQGIDVGARGDIYALLREIAERGEYAILFTSSDPDELHALADRALVLSHGRVVGELERGNFTDGQLLALAHGSTDRPHPPEEAIR